MDINKKIARKANPRQNSNILSILTFRYTLPMFIKGFKKELEEKDLYEVLPEYSSRTLGDKIEKVWSRVKNRKKHRMLLVLWHLHGKYYLLLGLTRIITIILSVLRPLITGKLVSFFVPGQTEMTKTDAYFYTFALISFNVIDNFYRQNYYMMAESLGIKFRTEICSLIYRKSLQIPFKHLHNVSIGKIINLVTRDVSIFDYFFYMFNDSWTGLISTAIICYHMYQKIGSAVFVLVVTLAIFMSCVVYFGNKMAFLKNLSCQKTDERINKLQQILAKIRCTKMYVWEKHVEKSISEARRFVQHKTKLRNKSLLDYRKEVIILFKMCVIMFLLLVTANLIQHVTYYLVILTCLWMGQTLTAETMYFVATSFQTLSYTLGSGIPYTTFTFSQVLAALKRFDNIIEELDVGNDVTRETLQERSDQAQITANNITLIIDEKIILKNINFHIDNGLTILLGNSSSGKSILFLSILKQIEIREGSLVTEGKISYASQEPWLFPSTIKQNIIFGTYYNEKRYQKVIKACALEYDLNLLKNGDDTIVSEQGINLSKGQQSRICLARAVYKECDIYLLDDCLSNMDPLVGSLIFNNCIIKLLKNKLVILVTNNLNLIPYANTVIKLNKGQVEISKNEALRNEDNVSYEEETLKNNFEEVDATDNNTIHDELIPKKNIKNIIYEESKKSGSVSLGIYNRYVRLGGGKIFVLVIFGVFSLGQICISYKDKVVSDWANLEEEIRKNDNSSQLEPLIEERKSIFLTYTFATIAIAFVILFRAYTLFNFSKKVSINLHSKMLKFVIGGTITFFDNTFIGNIVNRFSKDLVAIDENMPFILLHLTAISFETIGILILISFVNISFLLPTAILFFSLFLIRQGYLKTGIALKRLEATTKVSIVGYFNAVLRGLPTIKTFNTEDILIREFDKYQDLYTSTCYSNLSCMKAFVFAVDNLTSIFVASIILKFIIFDVDASAGDVGLSISQAFMMSGSLYFGFYKWAELGTQMTSVERALEYTSIHQENKKGIILENWPTCGKIEYKNVILSLTNCKSLVLKNLNFVINPKEKIGIVGRTGAGKSSILSTMFRLYEYSGNIFIDGTDIKTISLSFLRSRISIIPQDPLLVDGTIRYNLDPEREYSDEKIWKALETTKLNELFTSLETKIYSSEITVGQKQLICLSRIFLNSSKILLLDEITENTDELTESLIYDIVDNYFSECTIVKISHKMKFVMNCDKVLVIDGGEIIEYDSPRNLLLDSNGLFYKMASKDCLISS